MHDSLTMNIIKGLQNLPYNSAHIIFIRIELFYELLAKGVLRNDKYVVVVREGSVSFYYVRMVHPLHRLQFG